MLLSEIVFDLFMCNFIGLCETAQNVYILLTFKRTKKLCAYLFIYRKSPIIIIYKLIYWRNYKVMCCTTDMFLFNTDLKSCTALMQSCIDQLRE